MPNLKRKAAKIPRCIRRRDAEIGILLAGDGTLRALNRRFRGIDRATDVLSFPDDDPARLGDVAISVHTARRQARAFGHALEAELLALCVHGALHLLGYDHHKPSEARAMAREETRILRALDARLAPAGLVGRGYGM